MKRWIVKICLKILAWFYPKIDELLLKRFILVVFPGDNFGTLIGNNFFDRQIVFKVIKDKFRKLDNYYVIAVYYHESNKVVIQGIEKERVDSNDITRKVFNDLYNSL